MGADLLKGKPSRWYWLSNYERGLILLQSCMKMHKTKKCWNIVGTTKALTTFVIRAYVLGAGTDSYRYEPELFKSFNKLNCHFWIL